MKNIDKCNPCSKSDTNFHELPNVLTSVVDSIIVPYPPISALDVDASTLKFTVPGNTDTHIDLSEIYLYLKGSITDLAGADLAANAEVAPVNNFFYSLWSNVEISINGKQVTQPNSLMPYVAYFQNLLNYGQEAKNGHLQSILWYEDTAGYMNDKAVANKGYTARKTIVSNSKDFEMYGKVISDVTNQNKLLINGCEVSFVFHRARNTFCIMNLTTPFAEHKYVIKEATLFVRREKPSPSDMLKYMSDLERGPALYPLLKTDIRLYTISPNITSKEINGICTGAIPNTLICALTENEGLTGSMKLNPFNFAHHDVSSLTVVIGGRTYPTKLFNLDFTNNLYMRAYVQLFNGLGIKYGDSGIGINYDAFAKGYAIYIFDLSISQACNCSEYIEPVRESDLSIQIIFRTQPNKALSLIVYTETDAMMEINKDRQVYLDYS